MVQTSVQYQQAKGFEGMQASGALSNVRSSVEELINGTGTYLPFGRAVVAGAIDKAALELPSGTGDTFKGITLLNEQWGTERFDVDSAGNGGYPAGVPVGIMTKGDIWVYVESAVAVGDSAFFRHTSANANEVIGRFAGANSASHDAIAGATFLTPSTGPGLVILNVGGY